MKKMLIFIAGFFAFPVLVAVFIYCFAVVVPEGYRGMRVVRGVPSNAVLDEGLQWSIPWMYEVRPISVHQIRMDSMPAPVGVSECRPSSVHKLYVMWRIEDVRRYFNFVQTLPESQRKELEAKVVRTAICKWHLSLKPENDTSEPIASALLTNERNATWDFQSHIDPQSGIEVLPVSFSVRE